MAIQMKKTLALLLILCLLPLSALADGLKAGDTGDGVVSLQARLTELGLFVGAADGIYGDQTVAAVTEAQRLLNMAGYDVPRDGNADGATLALIHDDLVKDVLMTLCMGSKGSRVQQLQNRLIDLKLLEGGADGAYGTDTQNAVRAFQEMMLGSGAHGFTATGNADPDTLSLLNSDLSVYGVVAPIYYNEADPLSLTEDYLYSTGCILLDAVTGEVLFELNAHQRLYPASTTKIMTLMVSLEQGGLDQVVTIPKEAADVPADSSLVPVTVGEQMRKIDLLYGLIIRSGNDAANAIAVLDAGDIPDFVALMNEKAAALEMTETHFANPHGYQDENHYTTAYDLAQLTRQGLTDPIFCQVVTCLKYTLLATDKRDALTLVNTHEIFDPASPYYIPEAAGVKSGYTSMAGFCYVGAAQRGGKTLIAVTLHAPSRNRTWLDLQKLFAYGFAKEGV